MPNLSTLTINKNQIADTEGFLKQIKEKYPKLSFLSLLGNTASCTRTAHLCLGCLRHARRSLRRFGGSSPVDMLRCAACQRFGPDQSVLPASACRSKHSCTCLGFRKDNCADWFARAPMSTHRHPCAPTRTHQHTSTPFHRGFSSLMLVSKVSPHGTFTFAFLYYR
jgi:hypothetical protein